MTHQKPFRGVQLNRTHPLIKGLVGCWVFNEATGKTSFDLSGYGNHGALKNTAVWGDIGIELDGVAGYVDVGNNSSLKPPLPVTISLWCKLNELTEFRSFFRNDDNINYYGVELVKSINKLQINYLDGGAPASGNRRSKAGDTALSTNTLYHFVGVARGATDMDIYINGVNDGGTYSGTGGALVYSSSPASIGHNEHSAGEKYFDGSINNVCVYNRALSADEITLLYKEPYAIFRRLAID